MTKAGSSPKAPWIQRFGVVVFTVLAGLLTFWLLGFVVDDIGQLKGPQRGDVDRRVLDPKVVAQIEGIDREIGTIGTTVENLKAKQVLLRDSTSSSQQTMNQLLDMQKQNVENHVQPSPAEQKTLAESETLFIANQSRYQALNEELARQSEQQRSLTENRRTLDAHLADQKEIARREFEKLDRAHRLRVAGLQLLFLIPLLLAAVYLVLRWRTTIYAPLIYAFGISTLTKVIIVVHDCFPTRYFKYGLLLASLAAVIRILIYLIRSATTPKLGSRLRQFREAYEHFLCPICEYPIRRGPLKYSFWNRRSIRSFIPLVSATAAPDEPYSCPSCGSHLFEACGNCATVRPSLLPFCDHCGKENQPFAA